MLARRASYDRKTLARQVIPLAPGYRTALSSRPDCTNELKFSHLQCTVASTAGQEGLKFLWFLCNCGKTKSNSVNLIQPDSTYDKRISGCCLLG